MTTSQPDRARTGSVRLANGITVPVVVRTNLRQRRVPGMPPIILAVPERGLNAAQRAPRHHKRVMRLSPSLLSQPLRTIQDEADHRAAQRSASLTREGAWLAPRS